MRPWRVLLTGCLLWLLAGTALGATVSSQSDVGISSEYASNPFFLISQVHPAGALALFADLPVTYTGDTQIIELIPRFRVAEPFGAAALLSDYEYLDADWHWKSERNTFITAGSWHHDSTYYNEFEHAALLGHDLIRLEQNASLSWDRALSERSDLQLTGSWDKVAYSQNSASAVSNYTYAQGALQFNRLLSEQWQWTGSLGYGEYRLLNGTYTSEQRFAQTALDRTLSERWSLLAQVGYAYVTAHGITYLPELYLCSGFNLCLVEVPLRQQAARGSPNFSLTAQHQGERLTLNFAASRAIQPSGFGALLTQDTVNLGASYLWSERWTLSGSVEWARLSDVLGGLNLENRHYYNANLSANWLWTEKWTLQLQGTYSLQYLAPQLPAVHGVTIYLDLVRQLGRLTL